MRVNIPRANFISELKPTRLIAQTLDMYMLIYLNNIFLGPYKYTILKVIKYKQTKLYKINKYFNISSNYNSNIYNT